jgi:hypothetical protein
MTEVDLLRENAELRAGYARMREAFSLALNVARNTRHVVHLDRVLSELSKVLAETPIQSLEAIRAEAKEACAKLVEGYCDCVSDLPCDYCGELHEIASAIRALGDGGEVSGHGRN